MKPKCLLNLATLPMCLHWPSSKRGLAWSHNGNQRNNSRSMCSSLGSGLRLACLACYCQSRSPAQPRFKDCKVTLRKTWLPGRWEIRAILTINLPQSPMAKITTKRHRHKTRQENVLNPHLPGSTQIQKRSGLMKCLGEKAHSTLTWQLPSFVFLGQPLLLWGSASSSLRRKW